MDESEKIFFLKFVVRLWDDDDDDDKDEHKTTTSHMSNSNTVNSSGLYPPPSEGMPVDDDDRTTTRTTARCEYKFSVARLFFDERNFRSRLVLSAMALEFITKTVNRGYDLLQNKSA